MSLTIKEEKEYRQSVQVVLAAAEGAVEGLEGKIVSRDEAAGKIVAQFNKTIHGKVLGERTALLLQVANSEEGSCRLSLEAYPLDAVGRKLLFGARKGVTRTIVDWFYAHLEHRLQ